MVFLGDTLMKREKDYGYVELMVTLRFPDGSVIPPLRDNLDWSAELQTRH